LFRERGPYLFYLVSADPVVTPFCWSSCRDFFHNGRRSKARSTFFFLSPLLLLALLPAKSWGLPLEAPHIFTQAVNLEIFPVILRFPRSPTPATCSLDLLLANLFSPRIVCDRLFFPFLVALRRRENCLPFGFRDLGGPTKAVSFLRRQTSHVISPPFPTWLRGGFDFFFLHSIFFMQTSG